MKNHHFFVPILSLLLVILFNKCKVQYDFNGASIPEKAKTVSVQLFQNRAPLIEPSLSRVFTEALRDKFVSQTRLDLNNNSGDLNFEGEITGYSTQPMGIQGNETAAKNRLTITVRVKYSNALEPEKDFDANFSQFADYSSDKNLDEVAQQLIDEIVELLTEEIFNKAVVNW